MCLTKTFFFFSLFFVQFWNKHTFPFLFQNPVFSALNLIKCWENYFVAEHLCLKNKLPLLVLGASCCARTKPETSLYAFKSSNSFQTNAKESALLCVQALPVVPFGCNPHRALLHNPPHECLQAVAQADWMKGNLLFTRKSPKCAIRPKASHDRQFFFLLFFLLSSLS